MIRSRELDRIATAHEWLTEDARNAERELKARYAECQERCKPFTVWRDTDDALTWQQIATGF